MGTITILNLNEYKEQPVPEAGKEYHIFDDEKIRHSRHYIAKILDIIPFEECRDTELLDAWEENIAECYWLFAPKTDYFVIAESDYDENPLYFVRTLDGGWFSIDYPNWWMGARLDIDGSLYEIMCKEFNVEG